MAGGTASGEGHATDEQAKESGQMRLNVALYRVMAYVTGVVLIVLCVLAVMQIFVHDEAAVNVVGTIPVMTFIVERHISHRYIEPALAGGAAAPHPPVPEPRS